MTALRRMGLFAPLAAVTLAGCGLNSVPTAEEQVNAKWGDLQADYQRRARVVCPSGWHALTGSPIWRAH